MKMSLITILASCLAVFASCSDDKTEDNGLDTSSPVSIQKFGVLPENTPEQNKINLQKAIDWATASGAALFVEPVSKPYRVATGIRLKKNVSLLGVHGPTGRGTANAEGNAPVGSVFCVTDTENPFITVESATQIKGVQFWYSDQPWTESVYIVEYKPTIQVAKDMNVNGVTLSCLTFYGDYMSMDFEAASNFPCEQILIEHCYGYPYSGEFVKIDYCYDIPRMLHCHVNPAIMREFKRVLTKSVIDYVIKKKTFAYKIDHTDNAQMMDVFTFGTYGGIYLGAETYGQLTNFNLDCVTVGIHKLGGNSFNRNWQIAQGSIIANAGTVVADIHPFIIEGSGHTALTNVEAFSGNNPALTNTGQSQDFMLVRGSDPLTISMYGCRMKNYVANDPITKVNPNAKIVANACFDKNDNVVTLP